MKCGFCGTDFPKGTGMIYVRKTGKVVNFCSKKCEKNLLKLGRVNRNTRWTEAAAVERKKGAKK